MQPLPPCEVVVVVLIVEREVVEVVEVRMLVVVVVVVPTVPPPVNLTVTTPFAGTLTVIAPPDKLDEVDAKVLLCEVTYAAADEGVKPLNETLAD